MMKAKTLTAEKLIRLSMSTRFFRPRAGPLFAGWTKRKSNLVVIIGDNATGKSFFRRIIQSLCAYRCTPKVECIHLSMEGRTGGNSSFPIARAMIYGDETYNATGQLSSHVISTALKTAGGRDTPHVLFFDEPDVGLSDEYAMGAAKEIYTVANYLPETKAIFVVTHRTSMVRTLLRADPHVLIFGKERPATAEEWLERPLKAKSIKELEERGHALFKALLPMLKEK